MENTDVLISGAGIAGPALAYWLRRAGFAVDRRRARARRPARAGRPSTCAAPAATVVERMGLMDQARAGRRPARHRPRRRRTAGSWPSCRPTRFGGEGIISEIEILRGDLAGLLYEATCRTTSSTSSATPITGLDQDDDGVDRRRFEKAAPRRFGLVVGADGLHSAVRALAFGPEPDSSARWTATPRGSPPPTEAISTAGT